MLNDEIQTYMERCLELGKIAGKDTKSNPMVGSLIIAGGRIIGEGFHRKYGNKHSEIESFESVKASDRHLIRGATMFVSLEPCTHHGKTPPCADRIIREGIKKVIVSCEDPNPVVFREGIQRLRENGVDVSVGVQAAQGEELLRIFKKSLVKRPYIILKVVQSADGFIGSTKRQIWMSNKYIRMLTHKWRSEIDGIMIGKQTALTDNASLTTRLWPGDNPIRIVWDSSLEIPGHFNIFKDIAPTIILNHQKNMVQEHLTFKNVMDMSLDDITAYLYQEGICRLLVEGGSKTIDHFVQNDLWDEARIVTTTCRIKKDENEDLVGASKVSGKLIFQENYFGDDLKIYKKHA